MKKLILFVFTSFILMTNVNAETIEEQLNNLKNSVIILEQKVNDNEKNRLDKMHPIGSIFQTTTYSTVGQVQDVLGGKWEVYGSGKTLVGVDSSDEDFNIANKTGGSKATLLSVSNLPNHSHSIPILSGKADSAGEHSHNNTAKSSTMTGTFGVPTPNNHARFATGVFSGVKIADPSAHVRNGVTSSDPMYGYKFEATPTITMTNASAGAHTHTVTTNESITGDVGNGTSFTNLGPYITVYMYKRIA